MAPKFPRIPHLPFSPGATPDDERLRDIWNLMGGPVIITEKMDGANVCLTSDGVYARSRSGPATGSMFDELKAHHATVRHLIPPHLAVFAEWCHTVHTVKYESENFPKLFVLGVFSSENHTWQGFDYVTYWAGRLRAAFVPNLHIGFFEKPADLEKKVRELAKGSAYWGAPQREGVVVRPFGGVSDTLFGKTFSKFVNEGFTPGKHLGKSVLQPGRLPE